MTIGGWANQATGTPDSSQGLDVLKGKPRFTRPFFGRADSIASHRTNNTHAAGSGGSVWESNLLYLVGITYGLDGRTELNFSHPPSFVP